MIITHKLTLDLQRKGELQRIDVVQGDTFTRKIQLELLDDGKAWDIPVCEPVVRYCKSDGTVGIYDKLPSGVPAVSYTGNQMTLSLVPQMLTCPGPVQVQVELNDYDLKLTTFTLLVVVEPGVALAGLSEDYVNWSKLFLPQTTGAKAEQYLKISGVDADGRIIGVVPVDNPANEAASVANDALEKAKEAKNTAVQSMASAGNAVMAANDGMQRSTSAMKAAETAIALADQTAQAITGIETTANTALEKANEAKSSVADVLQRSIVTMANASEAKKTAKSAIALTEENHMPLFFFGAALPQTEEDEVIMPFRYVSKTQVIQGYCKTKAQGTRALEHPKKNQTTMLYADKACTEKLKIDFRGWGPQHKFCFNANWIDITHARNIVSARLWADVVKSRANYTQLPELLRTSPNQGAADGFPVKVYAGGVYQGRYTLNIPMDVWMTNMDDSLDSHCILRGESTVHGGPSHFRALPVFDGSDWSDEVHGTVPDSIKTRWTDVVSFVMNSTDSDFQANLGNYFDVDSLIDYYLFSLGSCHQDGFLNNQLYITYDGQKWIAGAYEMDAAWGLYRDGKSFVEKDEQAYLLDTGNLLYWRLSQLFNAQLKERWIVLRSGALSEANVLARFEQFIGVCPPHIVAEDYAATTGGGAFADIPSKDTNNIRQIRQYVVERLAWSDAKMGIDEEGMIDV